MAGFRPAKIEQAAIKMSGYGPPGSGKTFSALLFAEGLAQKSGRKIAYVDTEHGTDFYSIHVADRIVHPAPFVFDALYSRSLTEVLAEVRRLSPQEYGVVVVDSMTHLWEAARAAYKGKLNGAGQIPIYAWGALKKPYKDLVAFLINSPFHVFLLGRQANEFGQDEDTGEARSMGVKMKAEGETAYEPHVCLRFESVRKTDKPGKKGKPLIAVPTAYAEKDRSGALQGQVLEWPNFDSVIKPILRLLGDKQAQLPSEEDAALLDSEALRKEAGEKLATSRILRDQLVAKFMLAEGLGQLEDLSREISTEIKKQMLAGDLAEVRQAYLEARQKCMQVPVSPRPPAVEEQGSPEESEVPGKEVEDGAVEPGVS